MRGLRKPRRPLMRFGKGGGAGRLVLVPGCQHIFVSESGKTRHTTPSEAGSCPQNRGAAVSLRPFGITFPPLPSGAPLFGGDGFDGAELDRVGFGVEDASDLYLQARASCGQALVI